MCTIAHLPAAEPAKPKVVLSAEALAIHTEAPVFDGHNDLPWALREKKDNSFEAFDVSKNQPKLHTDIPRLKKAESGHSSGVPMCRSTP